VNDPVFRNNVLGKLPESIRETADQFLQVLSHQPHGDYKASILVEALNLISNEHENPADLKMMAHVMHEIRIGLETFLPYQAWRKVTVFGSARIKEEHPRYKQTHACAKALSEAGFMIITGGGGGMMQAANEGAGVERSFAINIQLPMEQSPNHVVQGSPRHFYCKYFFTRKLFFLKESDAVVLTAGGFGTLDEAFETLTLLQTGRTPPIPVVLLEAPGDDFWGPFIRSWTRRLVDDGLISSEDPALLYHTDDVDAATRHIQSFYVNYHSFRYAGDEVLLRLLNPLTDKALERLNAEFSDILCRGDIRQVWHWPKRDTPCFSHLPRLRMHVEFGKMNVLPQLIRRMNALYLNDHEKVVSSQHE